MSAHTPGPWFPFLSTEGGFDIGVEPNQAASDILCSRYDWIERKQEMHANARLIAAAPDLLAALKDIAEWSERWTAPGHPISTIARAAIDKATGAALSGETKGGEA